LRCPHNRPCGSVRLWDIEAHTFSKHSAHRWRWGCQPYAPSGFYLPPGRYLILFCIRGWVDPRGVAWLDRPRQLKKISGIVPATFLLVAYTQVPSTDWTAHALDLP
jgi:hypothetical protein